MIGQFVIVRTHMAGVHFGFVAAISADGKRVRLTQARRLWRWCGANTLNEVALRGAEMAFTRISEPVAQVILSEACEVISVTDEAQANLVQSRWGA